MLVMKQVSASLYTSRKKTKTKRKQSSLYALPVGRPACIELQSPGECVCVSCNHGWWPQFAKYYYIQPCPRLHLHPYPCVRVCSLVISLKRWPPKARRSFASRKLQVQIGIDVVCQFSWKCWTFQKADRQWVAGHNKINLFRNSNTLRNVEFLN